MPLPRQDADELFRLLSRQWDDACPPEALARIEEVVRCYGDSAIELILDYTAHHADVDAVIASSQAFDRAIDGIMQSEGTPRRTASRRHAGAGKAEKPRGLQISKWQAALIVAASVMIAVGGS